MRRPHGHLLGLGVGLLFCACAAPSDDVAGDPASALLRRASRLFDGRTLAEVGWEESLARLARADVVFLGETHLDQLTHDAELEFLRELAARRGGKVTLSMEMFERDAQPALDDFLAGRIGEADFLVRSRPWKNYPTDYRPLVELARRDGMPVVGANLPAELRGKLSRGGQEAFNALTPSERALVPAQLFENPPEYWERVENATRGHGAMAATAAPAATSSGGSGGASVRESRLFDVQNLWDNWMADAIARELTARPDRLVVHVVGSFHVEQWQGTAWQLLQRRPDAQVRTVAIGATDDLAGARPDDATPRADLLVRVEARARSEQDGAAAIRLAHEQRYRLKLPTTKSTSHASAAVASPPFPLLIWLCEDGQSLDDAIALWEPIVGSDCAVLALEPSWPFLGEDGVRRGRWYFPGDAVEGGGLAAAAIERVLAVVARDEPGGDAPSLPIDRTRVVVAGEHAGATMALCAARLAERAPFSVLAFAPAAQEELAQMSLPLPPGREQPTRHVALFDANARLPAWNEIVARDGELRLVTTAPQIGLDLAGPGALAALDHLEVDAMRRAFGLAPLAASRGAEELLKSSPDIPRARFFARVLARRARAAGLAQAPSLAVSAATFADGAKLPRSSGAFGGTTIVIVPDDASADELAAWKKLEDPDVLQKRSRFSRLRIAHRDRTPLAIIEQLRSENPQRRDFLLVPAQFCVDDAALRALRAGLGPLAEELRLEILPGLGDRLPVDAPPP